MKNLKQLVFTFLAFTSFTWLQPDLVGQAFAYQETEQEFQQWIKDFKPKAVAAGIKPQSFDAAFKGVKLNQRVLELDRKQPEFTQTFWQYFNARVTDWRVETGIKNYQKYQADLTQVTKEYGVPGRFIIAFWGMETNYGNYTGKMPIIESLATLAYNPRRSEFFSKQLIAALKIIDQGHVAPDKMLGSWAGAMGQTQFMPENYLKYAIDGDKSGKKNLWNEIDAFYSSGNFLQQLGWRAEENWGREVKLPAGFDYALADGKTKQPLSYWQNLGISIADGRELPAADLQAALLLPSGAKGPAFLVYHNFFVIKRWNMSDSYALAVGHLADRIVGRDALIAKQPKDDKALEKQQVIKLQQKLNQLGFLESKADGIAGNLTRQAVRKYQQANNLPADGFPSHELLRQMKIY